MSSHHDSSAVRGLSSPQTANNIRIELFFPMESKQQPDFKPPAKEPEHLFAESIPSLSATQFADYKASVKRGRIALYSVAGIALLATLSAVFFTIDEFDFAIAISLIAGLFIAGNFIVLGLWTRTKPYTALVASIITIIVYSALIMIALGIDEGMQGILEFLKSLGIFEAALLIFLFIRLGKARELQQAMQ